LLLIGAGVIARLAFALLPREYLFILLEDDAWMVTAIARHWAMGHGITADGLFPTNGFHPLYPLTLGAIPYLFAPDAPNILDLGFRLNVVICAILSSLALFPLYRLLTHVATRPLALGGLAVLSLNPFLIRVSVNAMETSLALLLLITLWWYALNREPITVRGGIIMGVIGGLATLARLDTMIAAGMLGLVWLWKEVRARQVPWVSISYGATVGVVLLPYFIRNMVVFGHLTPSSGRALSYMHSYKESFAFTSGLQLVAYQPAFDMTWAPAWLLAIGVAAIVAIYLFLPPVKRFFLTPLMLYTFALTFFYAYLQQQGRPRYYVGVAVALVVLVCVALDSLPPRPQLRRAVAIGIAVVAIGVNMFTTWGYTQVVMNAPYLAQPAMYQAARWIAEELPQDARLAAQNSGVFQYYSERVVLNFDGKLNSEIIPVLEERELDVYLRSKGVEYIVDVPGVASFIEFYSSNLSDAPAHHEISSLGKLWIYVRLVAAKAGFGEGVALDVREADHVHTPFSEVSEVVKEVPLPNDPSQAVTIYKLKDAFGRSEDPSYTARSQERRLVPGATAEPSPSQ
jgi:hypothetical protein